MSRRPVFLLKEYSLNPSDAEKSDDPQPCSSGPTEARTPLLTANAVQLLCKCSQFLTLRTTASHIQDTEDAVEVRTLLRTAKAVRLLCKCSRTLALRTTVLHIQDTKDAVEAMWAACKQIKPAVAAQRFDEHDLPVYQIPASGRLFIAEQLGKGARTMTLLEVAHFKDHLHLLLNNPSLDIFDNIPSHLKHFWKLYVNANRTVEQGQLTSSLLQRRIYDQACEDLYRKAKLKKAKRAAAV